MSLDPSPLVAVLGDLEWVSGGPGIYAMISDFPPWVLEVAEPIFGVCLARFPGRHRGMTLLSRLVPGQYIHPHQDRHDSHCESRIHVPLSTNPACVFVSDGKAFHMRVGEAHVINPGLIHTTANGGATDRVHLIFNAAQ